MAGEITTSTFFQLGTRAANRVYEKNKKLVPVLYKDILNVLPREPNRVYTTLTPLIEMGLAQTVNEGGTVSRDQASEGIPTTFLDQTWGLGYRITRDAQENDPAGILQKLPGMLQYSIQITKEQLVANIFNFATNAAVLGWDGVPLLSTAHPLESNPAVVQSNFLGTLALTPESFMSACQMLQNLLSPKGLPMARTPWKLVHSNYLYPVSEVILGSKFYPYSDENRPNVAAHQGVTPFNYRFITNPTAWYLLAPKGDATGIGADCHTLGYNWKYEERMRSWTDDGTENFNQTVKFRGFFGWLDWRGFAGSLGS